MATKEENAGLGWDAFRQIRQRFGNRPATDISQEEIERVGVVLHRTASDCEEFYEKENVPEPTGPGKWWRNARREGGLDVVQVFRRLDKMLWYGYIGSANRVCREEGVAWTGPIPVPLDAEDEPAPSENREHLLGEALLKVLVKIGVISAGASPTGPELLAAVEDWSEEYAYSHGEQHAVDFPQERKKKSKPKPAPSEDDVTRATKLEEGRVKVEGEEWGRELSVWYWNSFPPGVTPSDWKNYDADAKQAWAQAARRFRAKCIKPYARLVAAAIAIGRDGFCHERDNEGCWIYLVKEALIVELSGALSALSVPAPSAPNEPPKSTPSGVCPVCGHQDIGNASFEDYDTEEDVPSKPRPSDEELGRFAVSRLHFYLGSSTVISLHADDCVEFGAAIRAKLGAEEGK